MTRFDWPALMRAGIGGLRLSPREFWALTPGELALMLGPGGGVQPMARTRLEDLIREFPDGQKEVSDDASR